MWNILGFILFASVILLSADGLFERVIVTDRVTMINGKVIKRETIYS